MIPHFWKHKICESSNELVNEKWFVLHPSPNFLRDPVWGPLPSWGGGGVSISRVFKGDDRICLMFRGCIISRRLEIKWPPYLADLDILNFFFWSYAMIHHQQWKPAIIKELKVVVKDVMRVIPVDKIRVTVANVRVKMSSAHPGRREPLWSLSQTAIVVLHYLCIH